MSVPDSATGAGGFSIVNPGESHPLRPYWEYLCFLFRKLEPLCERDRVEADYRDYLQAPLQPLQVRLCAFVGCEGAACSDEPAWLA